MNTVSKLKHGQKGQVIKIEADKKLKRKLNNLGIVEGTEITVRRTAPFGDPIEVEVRGFRLAIRKREADGIILA